MTLQKNGSLAQLVQSTCLTSRGSLVRTQQFPHNKSLDYSRLLLLKQLLKCIGHSKRAATNKNQIVYFGIFLSIGYGFFYGWVGISY